VTSQFTLVKDQIYPLDKRLCSCRNQYVGCSEEKMCTSGGNRIPIFLGRPLCNLSILLTDQLLAFFIIIINFLSLCLLPHVHFYNSVFVFFDRVCGLVVRVFFFPLPSPYYYLFSIKLQNFSNASDSYSANLEHRLQINKF
jgi:hypothetical protein